MDYLEYDEIVRMRVSRICPNSTGTIKKQEEVLDPPGMTLVGFIKTKRNFNKLNEQLKIVSHGSRSAPNPHLTLLGLFSGNSEFPQGYENKIHQIISRFFNSRTINKFRIQFDQARPGRAYDIERNPMPLISDGTIFARACPCDYETQRFQMLSKELKTYIEQKLQGSFKLNLGRPYPTVWCTLGYFSQTLEVNPKIKRLFGEFKDVRKRVTISSLCLVRYENRKLPVNRLRIIKRY
jgi:hypothetical protein